MSKCLQRLLEDLGKAIMSSCSNFGFLSGTSFASLGKIAIIVILLLVCVITGTGSTNLCEVTLIFLISSVFGGSLLCVLDRTGYNASREQGSEETFIKHFLDLQLYKIYNKCAAICLYSFDFCAIF